MCIIQKVLDTVFFKNLLELTRCFESFCKIVSSSVFRSETEKNVSRTNNLKKKVLYQTKSSRYVFFQKPTRTDVPFQKFVYYNVSSSVFRSETEKNVSRTSEPKHKICPHSKTSRYIFPLEKHSN
ncbi:hypothetical protein EAG08_18290 [Chryseobacterium sp. 3008163]|nr:hypothetical protein EAG08_18290 [Chryseobacterium sp. 3008163]